MSGLIRILAVRHRDGIPERIFPKRTYFEKTSADDKKAWNINFLHSYMLGSRGVQFFFSKWGGGGGGGGIIEDQNTTFIGPSSARKWKTIEMAFPWSGRWWPNIECWLRSFVIFQGIRTWVLQRNPIFLWFFRGGVRTPCPPSGSAHELGNFACCSTGACLFSTL